MKVALSVDITWPKNNCFKVYKFPLSVTEIHERNRTWHYACVRTSTFIDVMISSLIRGLYVATDNDVFKRNTTQNSRTFTSIYVSQRICRSVDLRICTVVCAIIYYLQRSIT